MCVCTKESRKKANFSHVHMTLSNEKKFLQLLWMRSECISEKKKLIIFTYVRSTHVSKEILAMCQKYFFLLILRSEGEKISFLIFLFFSIIIYFYAFAFLLSPTHSLMRYGWRKVFFISYIFFSLVSHSHTYIFIPIL